MFKFALQLALFIALGTRLHDDGPPPPVPPAVISRDSVSGRATIRAVRVSETLHLDGKLDEPVYADVPPMTDFIQMEPNAGTLATEKTEAWILFDDQNVYVVFRCWESQPERMVVNEMRRDANNLWLGDNVAFMFDTFHDRRNGVEFGVAPNGGRYDGQITDERWYNGDWNPVWDVAVGRFSNGWTVETAIPFKSLRYRPDRTQVWGFQARRINAWKNELSFLTPLPPALGMGRGIFAASLAPTIVGLEAPTGSRNLEIKPYVIAQANADSSLPSANSTHWNGDGGVDLKYGLTRNLAADITYRTDFAQVEADEQQINLTRFSLFFPEKREFFLENQGMFTFGGGTGGDTPILFYSRQIGLKNGTPVPIKEGERLTGRLGRFSLGALNIRSGAQPAATLATTTFSAVRLKRDVLRRSSIGTIFTRRSVSQTGVGSNEAYGLDGTFAFFDNLAINAYWARTHTSGLLGADTSYRSQLNYAGDRYGFQLERLAVGKNFNPELGFVQRRDMRKNYAQFRFSPRPKHIKAVRKFYWTGSASGIANGTGLLETRIMNAQFTTEFQNSDLFFVGYTNDREVLLRPFAIASGVTLPVRTYNFGSVLTGYTLGPQQKFSGSFTVESGSFYDGRKTSFNLSSGRTKVTPRVSLQPSMSINRITLMEGSFTTRLAGARITYAITPMAFVSALVQYNSSANAVAANVRLRWEYRPGSELFVVYNEERTTQTSTFPGHESRGLIVKVTRMVRF